MGCWNDPTTKDAYRLAVVGLCIEALAGVLGIILFKTLGSALCLAFGLENFVDFLSSVVVLWRFFAPTAVTPEIEQRLARREQRASVLISFILMVLGIAILAAALEDLKLGPEKVDNLKPIMAIAFFSILIFGTLSFLKIRYSIKLNSLSLYKDGVCSLIGTVLSVALFVNALVIETNPGAWWLDPIISLGAGLMALTFGFYGIYVARCRDNLPICSCGWWFTSQGDGDLKTDTAEDPQQVEALSPHHRPGPEHFPATGSDLEMKATHATSTAASADQDGPGGDIV